MDLAGGFKHQGLRGIERESALKDFLRNFLPESYGIESGEVFDRHGNVSRQTDIIVYDKIFFMALKRGSGDIIVPCEGVYGGIEVKSNLSTDRLRDAIKNIRALKSLTREKSDSFDLTPRTRFWLADSYDEHGERIEDPDSKKMNSYFGIVVAREGITQESAMELLKEECTNNKNSLPDLVVNIGREYVISKYSNERPWLDRRDKAFEALLGIPLGEDTLPFLMLMINAMTHQTRLLAPLFTGAVGPIMQTALPNATKSEV